MSGWPPRIGSTWPWRPGTTGIALGNLTGSNILNLTLILGVAALIARLSMASSVIRREVPLAVVAVIGFGLVAFLGLNLSAAAVSR